MNRSRLGRWGEELVAKHLGFKRVPFSGGVWPYLEDLVKTVVRGKNTGEGGVEKYPLKYLAQVKTTEGDTFLHEWEKLVSHAMVEDAHPRWFEVVRVPGRAYIFETVLVRIVELGIGGDE